MSMQPVIAWSTESMARDLLSFRPLHRLPLRLVSEHEARGSRHGESSQQRRIAELPLVGRDDLLVDERSLGAKEERIRVLRGLAEHDSAEILERPGHRIVG